MAGGGLVGTRIAGSTCLGQGVPREASSSTSRASCWSLHRLLALPSTGKMVDASVWFWEWSRQYALSRSRRLLRQLASQQRDLLGRATLGAPDGFPGSLSPCSRENEMLVIQGTPARSNTSAGRMLNFFALPRYCVLVQAQDMPSSSPRESASACYRSGAQMERSLTDRRAGRILISQFAAPPLGRVI